MNKQKQEMLEDDLPVSEKIRQRLHKANTRFYATDNIAEFIKPGELTQLQAEVQHGLEHVLRSLVIDTKNDHNTQETAKRMAKMFIQEIFSGRYISAPKITEFPNIQRLNELLVIGPITIRSACAHHFCPIMGEVWLGVVPSEYSNLIGLSKYSRLVNWILSRPQIQEEATAQIADLLIEKLDPAGLAVVMHADHFCMHWRGVKDTNSKMISSVMRRCFLTDSELRREFLSFIKGQ